MLQERAAAGSAYKMTSHSMEKVKSAEGVQQYPMVCLDDVVRPAEAAGMDSMSAMV